MPNESWRRNTLLLAAACLLVPPVGIVLLWLRPGVKLASRLALSVALIAFTVFHLFAFYGLHVDIGGTGVTPIISFRGPGDHYDEIEESRRRSGAAEAASRTPSTQSANYWTDFRGPLRDGHYQQTPIRTAWPSDGPPELWRIPVGGGYASMVVANGRVFTIEQRRDQEVVAAYDFGGGRELWTHAWDAHFQESMGGDGPRATPTWHDGKIYALGAEGDFVCLDAATGELLWGKNILEEHGASNLNWGMAASPLIVDEKVIVQPGGSNGNSVVAYHKETGEVIWTALDDKQAYTSPMEVTLGGRRQIISVSAQRMMGLAIEDGALLWDYPWTTSYDVNAAQPLIVDENHALISAGYGHGAALVKVTASGAGFRAEQVWQNINMKNKFTSSVLLDEYAYGLDENILAAIGVRSGERQWKGGRYGYGQVILAGGHLIVLSERGDLALVKATPEGHQELARFSALSGKTWNHPAISDARLLVRNQTEMACYDLSVP